MLSKIRSTTVHSPTPGVIPDTITGPGSTAASDPDRPPGQTPGQSDPAGAFAATERDERRHQRALAREGHGRKRGARTEADWKRGATTGVRLHQPETPLAKPPRQGRRALGKTVSLGLIGIVLVGFGAGALLGALGAAGWVVGVVVATLTLTLSAALRRAPRQRLTQRRQQQ